MSLTDAPPAYEPSIIRNGTGTSKKRELPGSVAHVEAIEQATSQTTVNLAPTIVRATPNIKFVNESYDLPVVDPATATKERRCFGRDMTRCEVRFRLVLITIFAGFFGATVHYIALEIDKL